MIKGYYNEQKRAVKLMNFVKSCSRNPCMNMDNCCEKYQAMTHHIMKHLHFIEDLLIWTYFVQCNIGINVLLHCSNRLFFYFICIH